jgi:eukaryotic-like serine/threonine-protein kinase
VSEPIEATLSTHTIICKTCGRPQDGAGVEGLCELCLLEFGWRGLRRRSRGSIRLRARRYPDRAAATWRRVGDYELLSEIARGGMGVVYRARQLSLNRMVALKMILVGHWASASLVQRFQLEARANARLDHPHIVPILELGEFEGWHYFTMKLVEGEDLARQQQAGRWPAVSRPDQERIAQLMREVSGAVHFAHQRGILHRDLKPTNILVDSQGAPYVTDFGLAKLIEETSDLTRTSAALGTPAYMAPEQAAGKADEITLAADIYSLGAILYELLTGSPVHSGRTSLETVRRVLETEIIPPARLNPQVAADLATICLRCLRREPAARYASAAELAEDLGRWLRREPIEARPVTSLERLDYWRRRNPLAAVLSALLLLTLLVTGVVSSVLALRMREARDEAREYATESQRIDATPGR